MYSGMIYLLSTYRVHITSARPPGTVPCRRPGGYWSAQSTVCRRRAKRLGDQTNPRDKRSVSIYFHHMWYQYVMYGEIWWFLIKYDHIRQYATNIETTTHQINPWLSKSFIIYVTRPYICHLIIFNIFLILQRYTVFKQRHTKTTHQQVK